MNDIREDLKAFVDGELSPARMAEVQAAIASDPTLQREVEYMKILGFEIKKMASEPAVVGKEQAVSKFRRQSLPWWNPATLSGRFAYAGALFLVLGGLGVVFFPIFAQSKQAAKATATLAMNKAEDSAGAAAMEFRSPDAEVPGSPLSSGELMKEKGLAASPSAGADVLEGEVYNGIPPAELKATPRDSAASKNPQVRSNATSTSPGSKRTTQSAKPAAVNVPPTNRLVIKNADVSLKVEDAKDALTEAEQLAKSLGGYVEGGNLTAPEGETPRSSATLRVPSKLYETAMKALRGMGEVLSENSNASDVTAQHADVEARVKVLRAEESSYIAMLRAARRLGEIMELREKISQIRQQVESLEAQRKSLASEAALSTIRATFTQKAKIGEEKKEEASSGFDETWANAVNKLSTVGEFLGNVGIYLFVFAPVWLPPVLLFWWLGKRVAAG